MSNGTVTYGISILEEAEIEKLSVQITDLPIAGAGIELLTRKVFLIGG